MSFHFSALPAANAPAIVVAHTPTELVVSDGKADFTPVTDDLLAMSNTDSELFMDVKSQNYFLVISGRWYKSSPMTGKWHYVASDKLPATFAEIPKDSKYGDVRPYVANTDEAREAVMDAQIPQTAAVKRGPVDIKLTYDGKPEFKKIDGTSLQFAVNCSETVIEEGKKYYLVKDAVWYISDSATGPWVVSDLSDHAPPGIDKVPPSSPVYNTKYVYVYDSTPEVVYVGDTPGYVGSYIYGPTIVYGTGYYYYPRPATWGFSVSYNPWTGWGFGMSWSSGPFLKNRMSTNQGTVSGINRQVSNTLSIGQLSTNDMRNKAANLSTRNRLNNILTDEKGNVLRNNNGQWQQRDQGQWQNRATPATTENVRSNIQQRSGYDRPSSVGRQQYSRQRATERTQHRSRPSGGSHRGGGGRRR